MYTYLEPLYNDNRRVRLRTLEGHCVLSHIDEVIDDMLRKDYLFDVALPHIPARWAAAALGRGLAGWGLAGWGLGARGWWVVGGGRVLLPGRADLTVLHRRPAGQPARGHSASLPSHPLTHPHPHPHPHPPHPQADDGEDGRAGAARERAGRGV